MTLLAEIITRAAHKRAARAIIARRVTAKTGADRDTNAERDHAYWSAMPTFFKSIVYHAAQYGHTSCDMLIIEPSERGSDDHFNYQRDYRKKGWLGEMTIAGLKGRAKAAVEWAKSEGFAVSIRADNRRNPTLNVHHVDYVLVASWPAEAPAETTKSVSESPEPTAKAA